MHGIDFRHWKWLVELLNLFEPAWRVVLLVAAGVRAAPVEQNNSEELDGFSITAPDPRIQMR